MSGREWLCRGLRKRASFSFQSPSRGGHLRGTPRLLEAICGLAVSVPFTRGTPPWLEREKRKLIRQNSFSPLHEGDTSVAGVRPGRTNLTPLVSVPFTRGTPPWLVPAGTGIQAASGFQSPSRGGHLRGTNYERGRLTNYEVSVPFTRGTPPWHQCGGGFRFLCGVSVPFTRGTPPWRTR